MFMSRYHKCEPVRHKHKHKHNEAAVFDISGNIIENSAQSLPADLQFPRSKSEAQCACVCRLSCAYVTSVNILMLMLMFMPMLMSQV